MAVAIDWASVEHVVSLGSSPCSGDDCPICLDRFAAPRVTPCGHVFCLTCVMRFLEATATTELLAKDSSKAQRLSPTAGASAPCPVCKSLISMDGLRSVTLLPKDSPCLLYTSDAADE